MALLLPMICHGEVSANQRSAKTIERLKGLKPENVELSPIVIVDGQIDIEGFTTDTRYLSIYLHSIEDSKIGLVRLQEIVPADRDGRRVTHFKMKVDPIRPEPR
jgi:hypothetical protein